MDFIDQLKQSSECVKNMEDSIQTEEATKTVIIMPFFSMFDYGVFNPQEFAPELAADVGMKEGEEADCAVIRDGQPVILIEYKPIPENLDRHDSQLFRYFGTTTTKFAILTNGIIYRFYTDLDSPNKMDDDPFLTINTSDVRKNQVLKLRKFSKSVLGIGSIFGTVPELKYVHELKHAFTGQLDTPADDFVHFFLQGCYSGPKTQSVIKKSRPVLRKALNDLISEMMSGKIKTALGGFGGSVSVIKQELAGDTPSPSEDSVEQEKQVLNIVITEEELEAFFIVKNLFADLMGIHEITYKDTEPYIDILYKGDIRKWICRPHPTDNQKTLIVPDEDKKEHRFTLSDIYELGDYKDILAEVLQRYL